MYFFDITRDKMNKKEIIDYTRKVLSEAHTGVSSDVNKQPISTQPLVTNIVVSDRGLSIVFALLVCMYLLFIHGTIPIKAVVYHQMTQEYSEKNEFLRCSSKIAKSDGLKAAKRITRSQANEIKDLIKKLSQKEQKTPNMIHRELKKRFNYARYREINSIQYFEIKQALLNRLQYE